MNRESRVESDKGFKVIQDFRGFRDFKDKDLSGSGGGRCGFRNL